MPPTYYRGCWHVVSRGFLVRYRPSSSLLTGLYAPGRFFTHAASLHQGSPHCAISPTAASRRSLGRVSVPVWPSALSGRLLIVALVGRYPANWLIRRGPILYHRSFQEAAMRPPPLCGISTCFQVLSPCTGQVAHALLTRPPLMRRASDRNLPPRAPVRLACVRHAASVHPEPGSNSHVCPLSCRLPSAGFTVFLGPVVFSTVFLSFEFPLNLPSALRFFLPAFFLSGFFFPASRFLGTSGIFRAALLFICQGSSCCRFFLFRRQRN